MKPPADCIPEFAKGSVPARTQRFVVVNVAGLMLVKLSRTTFRNTSAFIVLAAFSPPATENWRLSKSQGGTKPVAKQLPPRRLTAQGRPGSGSGQLSRGGRAR